MSNTSIAGCVALVTGANRGLGRAITRAPDVNLLFNNAGIVELGRTWAAPDLFEASRRETEVNVISIAALANVPLFISYSLSKAALHSFTQSARMSLRAQGTAVIGVYPGPVDTDIVAGAILDGVEAGIEEVFPDPMSRAMGATFGAGPKERERKVAAMFAA